MDSTPNLTFSIHWFSSVSWTLRRVLSSYFTGKAWSKDLPQDLFCILCFMKLNMKWLQDSFIHSKYIAKHSSQLFIRWQSPQEPSLLGLKASFKFLWQRFIGWQFWFQAMFWSLECSSEQSRQDFCSHADELPASEGGQWVRSFQLVLWAKRKMVG